MEKLINRKLINYARDIAFFSRTGFAGTQPICPHSQWAVGLRFLGHQWLGIPFESRSGPFNAAKTGCDLLQLLSKTFSKKQIRNPCKLVHSNGTMDSLKMFFNFPIEHGHFPILYVIEFGRVYRKNRKSWLLSSM